MKRKVICKNGNTVERFYERSTRSSVVIVKDGEGNQIGEAEYDGNPISHATSFYRAIKDNGGEISTAEFKARIRALCGIPEAISGAKRAHPCLVRTQAEQINRPKMNEDPTKPI